VIYGTLAATTPEAVPLGQVAASLVDLVYVKSIDNTMYINPTTTASTGDVMILAASEACLFRPYKAGAAAVAPGVWSATAESNYEAIIVGQSS
jgi:hypothetical protein